MEIFGLRRNEVVGQTTLTLGIWPDPLERVKLIDRFQSERSVKDFEISLRVKNGDVRQFLISTDLISLKRKQCLLTIGNDITERKRAEEALRQSEERWQLAATGTIDGIWDWDVAGHTVFLSARWKQLRGYREEEIGVDETEWSSRIHPEDFSRVMAAVQSYFNKEIPAFHCEYRTRRKDGTYFWISDRGVAVWDAQGRVVRMVGSETDITERKRGEAELRHSEGQFRTVVESAPNGILLVDGRGRIVLVNGQIERQFGYRREELIGHPVERLLPGRLRKDHAGLREAYQEAPEARAMGRGRDLYGLRKDGSELPIEIGLSSIETISGTMVLASVVDITERKQREHALAEQRRLYKTVTDNAALALFIMDDSQQCVFMNPAAEALTGFALAEVMGRPLHDVVHHTRPDGSHYPLSECPIDQAFPKNDREQGEEVFVHKDGHFYSVAFTASPIRNELGQPVGTVIEVQDITRRKRAEVALRESEARLQAIMDRAPVSIFMKDRDGRCLFMNEECARVMGFDRTEVKGKTEYELYPAELAEQFRMNDQVVWKSGQGHVFEEHVLQSDGLHTYVSTKFLLREADGSLYALCGIASDITPRRRMEEALREGEQRLRLATETAAIGIWEWNVTTNHVRWDAQMFRIYGVSQTPDGLVTYDTWREAVVPEDLHEQEQILRETIQSRGSSTRAFRIHRYHDGEERYIEAIETVRVNEQGETEWVVGTNIDVTARKHAEAALRRLNETLEQRVAERTAALRESEERFRTFLNNASNLAFMKACDGRYLYVNRRFAEAFQLEKNEIVGKTDVELFSREQAELFQRHDRSVLEAGTAAEFEEMSRYADGLHTNIVVKFPVRNELGHVYAIGGIVTDITDRKKAELTLRQNQLVLQEKRQELQRLTEQLFMAQDSERQRIARDLHDDFGQRLVALTLDVAALERNPPLMPELLSNSLESVREELAELSNDLRQLAHRLHPSLLKHAGLRAALEEFVQQAMHRTGLHITLQVNNVPDSLPLDLATCLFRVCQESLQNVAKHAKATDVLVMLSGSSKGLGLSVTDNGTGVNSHNKNSHGKGLGLISMQERLRLLNGFLNIHFRTAGGTKVCAWIPLQEKNP